jgi:arylformamidase
MRKMILCFFLACGVTGDIGSATAVAGSLKEALTQRAANGASPQVSADLEGDDRALMGEALLPTGARLIRDVAYGSQPAQRMDVYLPARQGHAVSEALSAVIFMVHGGGWRRGDKAATQVVANKVAHWLPRGVIVISTNYRMLPDADPWRQAEDVALALRTAQAMALREWSGNPDRFVLMGHSAGAHLVALLAADPQPWIREGAHAWLGTVALDSASLDVVATMEKRHFGLYDRAFGEDRAFWLKTSPLQQLKARVQPFLLVCSELRETACSQARAFANKVRSYGGQAEPLPVQLSHMKINAELGANNAYTEAVDQFLTKLGFP